MEHGVELGIAIVVCLGLASGAALRWVARKTGLPYTVAMLLLGLALGVGLERWVMHVGEEPLHYFGGGLPGLSPDLILFVFLPALVFESAFALDVHAFRRNLSTVVTLAVPALIVAIVLTALLAWALVGAWWGWGLAAGLVFGALISATDPVAVVAVLRELGAPKRLSLLIEGESLLNDGTAIVAFGVLLALLVPGASEGLDAGGTALRFVEVVAGGVAVGLGLAWLASFWLSRTFNDPLVEITVTLVLAYAAMVVAEGLLHVSGVMAIVTAGLWMAGPGQTRISPEVRHFLHRFWEMLAFLANTLIFFLVGLAIAPQLGHAHWTELALIAAIYGGVVAVRFAVTFGFLPLIRAAAKDPVRTKEATVMAWGGLRGAVSLALALVVSQHPDLDPVLRQQVLRLTAGVVLLTILVNGTTTGWLLRKLGFVTPSPSERLAQKEALAAALAEVDLRIDELSADPELASLPWRDVRASLSRRRRALGDELEELRDEVEVAGGDDHRRETWRRAIRIEREAYWSSFADGVLGGVALRTLEREVDHHLDELRAGHLEPPARRAPELRGLRSWLARELRSFGLPFGAAELGRLTLLYDTCRAEADAADTVISALDELQAATEAMDEAVEAVRATYAAWRRGAKHRLEDMRANLPEVVAAIEARLAERIELNVERDRVRALAHRGALSEAVADRVCRDVEARMKELVRGPRRVALPETAELCRNTPLLRGLDEGTLEELAELTVEQALAPGETLFEQGDPGDAMYVIVRGAIRLTRIGPDGHPRELDVLSTGEVIGEMALLTGRGRNAAATALTGAVVGRISRADFRALLEERPEVRHRVWAAFARHAFDDVVGAHPELRGLDASARRAWLGEHQPVELRPGEAVVGSWAMLVDGALEAQGERVEGPDLVELEGRTFKAAEPSVVVPLPRPPRGSVVRRRSVST
jgi:Na+/H+ antiporter